MTTALIGRFRDYAIGKSEDKMQDAFLTRIQKMKPTEVRKLAGQLKKANTTQRQLQDWLLAFADKKPRYVLVDGAKQTIKAVKFEEDLFTVAEGVGSEDVHEQQVAALTLVSMICPDYPALEELKLVASGSYDVGAAWYSIYLLDRGVEDLSKTTEAQLSDQKKLIKRLKDLVDERKKLAAK